MNEPIWSCLINLESLNASDVRLVKNFKHSIIHPFKNYLKETDISSMTKIKVNLEICMLLAGKPCGPAIISYEDNKDNILSFKAVGYFNENGTLGSRPFLCINGSGLGILFSHLVDGRPHETSHYIGFNPEGHFKPENSHFEMIDASGFLCYSGGTNKEGLCHGKGKLWYCDGDVFLGHFLNGQ